MVDFIRYMQERRFCVNKNLFLEILQLFISGLSEERKYKYPFRDGLPGESGCNSL